MLKHTVTIELFISFFYGFSINFLKLSRIRHTGCTINFQSLNVLARDLLTQKGE